MSRLISIPGKDGQTLAIDPQAVTAIEDYVVNSAVRVTNTYTKVFVAGQHVFITTMDATALLVEVNGGRAEHNSDRCDCIGGFTEERVRWAE